MSDLDHPEGSFVDFLFPLGLTLADSSLALGHGMRGLRIIVRAASTKAAVTAGQSRAQRVRRTVELAKLQPLPKGRPGHINVRLIDTLSVFLGSSNTSSLNLSNLPLRTTFCMVPGCQEVKCSTPITLLRINQHG